MGIYSVGNRHFEIRPFEDMFVWSEVDESGIPFNCVGTSAFIPLHSPEACIRDIHDSAIDYAGPYYGMSYGEASLIFALEDLISSLQERQA